uniref:Uncharacterized protein n=1 Tax=Alexandrium monilatum TaxID=311494 RepID=A0A7S4PXR4_9DINO
MTWEGHFRVPTPPPERSSLIGTYGSNHDTDLYHIDATRRRRHAAVWIDASGMLSMTANVGVSSGRVVGPNVPVADGRWHHVAAVFQRGSGGAQVTFSIKVDHVEYALLTSVAGLVPLFEDSFKRAIAAAADTTADHISTILEDGYVKPLRAVRVHCSINVPAENADTMRSRLSTVPWVGGVVAKNIMNTPRMYNAIPTGPDTVVVTSQMTLPLVRVVGNARLYVDGFPGVGTVTYAPIVDNIGMDGQLVVGGGHKGRAISCEVSRFRLWSVALAPAQLQKLRGCVLPSLPSLVGGPWPHGLQASYALNGTRADAAGTGFEALQSVSGGRFIVGGSCSADRCPRTSPHGCLLVAGRELRFNSVDQCESFARFVHCRVAGSSRGRPAALTGCAAPLA